MTPRFVDYYMDIAERTAQLSRARRLQVGAIIVKESRIVSIGFNGTPAGWDNNCEDKIPISPWPAEFPEELGNTYTLRTRPEVIHAERNALDKLAKQGGIGGQNATMFVTHAPCIECAKSIYGSGITEVFYREDYSSEDGIYFLKKCGIKIVKISRGDK